MKEGFCSWLWASWIGDCWCGGNPELFTLLSQNEAVGDVFPDGTALSLSEVEAVYKTEMEGCYHPINFSFVNKKNCALSKTNIQKTDTMDVTKQEKNKPTQEKQTVGKRRNLRTFSKMSCHSSKGNVCFWYRQLPSNKQFQDERRLQWANLITTN